MRPLIQTTAFIIESESSELPKKVKEAITKIGIERDWFIGSFYVWRVEQPKGDNPSYDEINTYLLNNRVKYNSYVFVHF